MASSVHWILLMKKDINGCEKMINVIGLGYIGLPTALMLAASGNEVIGTDYNSEVVSTLRSNKVTFEEEGLEELFQLAVKNQIVFTCDYAEADMYIVSVPTPYDVSSKKLDASYVTKAVNSIIDVAPKGAIIVIESTISPGTIDRYIRPMIQERGLKIGEDLYLAHAPERILPGKMLYELRHNSRTIGADELKIAERVKKVYASFCQNEIVTTSIKTAEMTKVVENTFRDINIAYANELAKICRAGEMDVYEIIRIANKHPRVNILSPGPGVGGHCISVDPWFLVGDYPGLANIILAARKINDSMPEFVLERVYNIMKENNMQDVSRVGFYGLTYKEDVDDVRESPTLQVFQCMKKHLCGENVKFYDPYVKKEIVSNQYYNLKEFLEQIDLVVIMVAHKEICTNVGLLSGKIVLDTRNQLKGIETYKL